MAGRRILIARARILRLQQNRSPRYSRQMLRLVLCFLLATAVARAWAEESIATRSIAVPFDFSRSVIGVKASIRGTSVYLLLDTGVDPSVIDLAVADALGLSVDRHDAGEGSGFGDSKAPTAYPSAIDALEFGGQTFPAFEALATDLSALSSKYGTKLDGMLGFSFLSDKIILIDYPRHELRILRSTQEARLTTGSCRKRWKTTFRTVDSFPIIPKFRFGSVSAPVSLDTGSNSGVGLFQSALDLPAIRSALRAVGDETHEGFQGKATTRSYVFDAPIGFGPFSLPPGQKMFLHGQRGSLGERVANVGNEIPAALQLRLMIDYPGHSMIFFGNCD